ncbi:MAG TPA: MFS transporter, partial [bacterium]|nr:MFS transporter [bacterium]
MNQIRNLDNKIYIKIFYFLIYAAMGIYSPFLAVYFKQIGIPEIHIGVFLSVSTGITFLSSTFWGYISDKKQNRNGILLICIIGNTLSIFLFLFSSNYYYVFSMTILAAFFFKPLLPLTDNAALDAVKSDSSFYSYGKIRVWGTIGFLFANFILSFVIEKNGMKWLFILNGILMMISLSIPMLIKKPKIDIEPHKLELKNLLYFFKKHFIIVYISCVLVEITNTVIYGFYSIYLGDLNFNSQMIGLCWGIGVLIEIPIFLFSNRIIELFGIKITMISGICAHLLKFFVLSEITAATNNYLIWILLLQITHGAFFGLFYAGLVNLIFIASPAKLQNSGQSIFVGSTYSIGAVAGFALNGYIAGKTGFSGMFLLNSILLLS